jgi:L-histidine Nalpha-methyltransferase
MKNTHFIDALANALETRTHPWSFCLVADDAERKLQDLIADLTRPPSNTGDGKRITSGFSYWGIEPTFAWARSCTDPLYPVMKESIESFTTGWADVQPHLGDEPYHYVSFGPGTGQKDATIVRDLLRRNQNLYYVPVDMSAEMLRLAVRGPIRQLGLPPSQILPVQLDFASQTNVAALWAVLEQLTGDEPVLFSLLGNTVANFDDDAELLRTLTARARPQDRFLLEAATADQLDEQMANAAALEYRQSRSFCEFATSALLRHTDLRIEDMDRLVFAGSVEEEKSLKVKVMYQNLSGRQLRFTLLPNRTSVLLPAHDTIRVYLTRKYVATGLKALLADCRLNSLASTHSYFVEDRVQPRFGMDLMLVSASNSPEDQDSTSAYDLWG